VGEDEDAMFIGKPEENHRKMGKSHRKTIGKWENPIGKP
jgi:hypothetical protein